VPLGHLIHPLLPHLGVTNPITAWWVAPIVGFILASIPFMVAAHMLHVRSEHYYKYHAGDLRLALWSRLNTRLGICIGLLNGAVYFILISFFIFNMGYWTTQAAGASDQPLTVRLANSLADGLEKSGFSQTAVGVGKLSPTYYKLADLTGLLMQNPQLASRFAEYPALISLWHRPDMQSLVTDPLVTNALASGTSLSEILKTPSMQGFIQNKDLNKVVLDSVTTNLDDLTNYLSTGYSAKYSKEPILGNWGFNAGSTLAWFRQEEPKMGAKEMAAIRALWSQGYSPATLLLTADYQLYIKGWPKFEAKPQPNQPPFQSLDAQGDWSRDGANYTLHFTLNGEDKYLSGTTDGLRLKLKDGRNLLIFDRTE
jgi:hypothetical protein